MAACSECGPDKYRVLPCKTYISVGNCPYRDRCVYLHDPRIGSKSSTKTSTRRKNKEDAVTDAFFWPTATKSMTRQDSHRKSHVVQAYFVDPGASASQLLVHSMWEHFVDVCRGTPALNANQTRSVHAGRKRLPLFQALSRGSRPSDAASSRIFKPVTCKTGQASPKSTRRQQQGAHSPVSVTAADGHKVAPALYRPPCAPLMIL